MITIDGVRYRPEDAERLKVRQQHREERAVAALTTKKADPPNKARTPEDKS